MGRCIHRPNLTLKTGMSGTKKEKGTWLAGLYLCSITVVINTVYRSVFVFCRCRMCWSHLNNEIIALRDSRFINKRPPLHCGDGYNLERNNHLSLLPTQDGGRSILIQLRRKRENYGAHVAFSETPMEN